MEYESRERVGGMLKAQATPRKAVMLFARAMEEKLQRCDYDKGEAGWLNSNTTIEWLLLHLRGELQEAQEAFNECDPETLAQECVDIANFAMMICDRIRLRPNGVTLHI